MCCRLVYCDRGLLHRTYIIGEYFACENNRRGLCDRPEIYVVLHTVNLHVLVKESEVLIRIDIGGIVVVIVWVPMSARDKCHVLRRRDETEGIAGSRFKFEPTVPRRLRNVLWNITMQSLTCHRRAHRLGYGPREAQDFCERIKRSRWRHP